LFTVSLYSAFRKAVGNISVFLELWNLRETEQFTPLVDLRQQIFGVQGREIKVALQTVLGSVGLSFCS
jgi:hypothetical protein